MHAVGGGHLAYSLSVGVEVTEAGETDTCEVCHTLSLLWHWYSHALLTQEEFQEYHDNPTVMFFSSNNPSHTP